MNPQYVITLEDIDDDDEDNLCTCVVALMQRNRRIKRKMGLDNLTIGFAIYEMTDTAPGQTKFGFISNKIFYLKNFILQSQSGFGNELLPIQRISGTFGNIY